MEKNAGKNIKHLSGIFARQNRVFLVACAFLCVLACLCVTKIFLGFDNTLFNNPDWVSSKAGIKNTPRYAFAYDMYREALTGESLNLHPWYGFQRVEFARPLRIREISFELYLGEKSWGCVLFNIIDTGFAGVRFSTMEAKPCLFFESTFDGEFAGVKKLKHKVPARKWLKVRLMYTPEGVDVFLDGRNLGLFPLPVADPQRFGFMGGSNCAKVDNVYVVCAAPDKDIGEDFSNRRGFPFVFAVVFLAGIVVLVVVFCVFAWYFADVKKALFGVVTLELCLLAVSVLFFGFDFKRPLFRTLAGSVNPDVQLVADYRASSNPRAREVVKRLEEYSNACQRSYVTRKVMDRYSTKPDSAVIRIMFIGTSQTFGEGVDGQDQTFVSLCQNYLNGGVESGEKSYECINCSVVGSVSDLLLDSFKRSWVKLKPDVCVINIANNDERWNRMGNSPERFEKILEEFVSICRKNGIIPVFSFEAACPEVYPDGFRYHDSVNRVAQRLGVEVLYLHRFLAQHKETGFLWWDYIHLTQYGHRLAAEFFASQLPMLIARNGKNNE